VVKKIQDTSAKKSAGDSDDQLNLEFSSEDEKIRQLLQETIKVQQVNAVKSKKKSLVAKD
jgi:hypothetical protein